MSLQDQLTNDMKQAMKDHDKTALAVIRMVKTAIKNTEISNGEALDDSGILGVLAKEVKQRQDTIAEVKKAGRDDLVNANEAEIKILQKYLPEPLTDDEISQIIDKAIADTGAASLADMGKVMGKVQPQIKGRADGGKVSAIVKEKLG